MVSACICIRRLRLENKTPWRQDGLLLSFHAARLTAKPLEATWSLCLSSVILSLRRFCRILAKSLPKLSASAVVLQLRAVNISGRVFSAPLSVTKSCRAASYSGHTQRMWYSFSTNACLRKCQHAKQTLLSVHPASRARSRCDRVWGVRFRP